MKSLWNRIPVVVRAVLVGAVGTTTGTIPWALLVYANSKFLPQLPWAVPPAALYLWLWWRYANGEGWPRSTSAARRRNVRAKKLSSDIFSGAIGAGMLGTVTFLLFMGVLGRVVHLPGQDAAKELGHAPVFTTLVWLLMGSTVAGVVEEASFRGYMQRPIEEKYGPIVAILVVGVFFALAHATHAYFSLVLLPYFMIVAAMYGGLAWATKSIMPGLFLHAGLDVIGGLQLLATGKAEWIDNPRPLVWEIGTDLLFWLNVAALVGFGVVTIRTYIALANSARNSEPVTTSET